MTTSVLVVSAAADDRPSTLALRDLVDALRADERFRVTVWFLRNGPRRDLWPDARVIDELRTWGPVATLRRRRWERAASRVAGARLRWWWRAAAPTVVVLDDGLGGRTLRDPNRVAIVVRHNVVPPGAAALEQRWSGPVALAIEAEGIVVEPSAGSMVLTEPEDLGGGRARPSVRIHPERVRALLNLPAEGILVGWPVGADVADPLPGLRVVAALEARTGRPAHLLWAPSADRCEPDRSELRDAALGDLGRRLHIRPSLAPALLGGCDVILAAGWTDGPASTLAAAGSVVAADRDHGLRPPWILAIDLADPEAAAVVLEAALRPSRAERAAAAAEHLERAGFHAALARALAAVDR